MASWHGLYCDYGKGRSVHIGLDTSPSFAFGILTAIADEHIEIDIYILFNLLLFLLFYFPLWKNPYIYVLISLNLIIKFDNNT